jgi:hypothetical protein
MCPWAQLDEDDLAFKQKQKADAAALKDLQAKAAKGGPLGKSFFLRSVLDGPFSD